MSTTPDPAHYSAQIAALAEDQEREHARLLVLRANAYLAAMEFQPGRADLDAAAALHRQGGRSAEHAKCLHLAATASRLSGDLHGARDRAELSKTLAPTDSPMAVSALAELGETWAALGDPRTAAAYCEQAAETGARAGLLPTAQAQLLRRAGSNWVQAGVPSRAALIPLRKAAELLTGAGDIAGAVRARIEEASAWAATSDPTRDGFNASYREQAEQAMGQARIQAEGVHDLPALADLAMLRSTLALYDRDLESALLAAQEAQALALKAVQPLPYTTSTLAISRLSDEKGDRLQAYRALAVGWATLGDLMGEEVGQATFAPKLQELVSSWGEEEFVRVRDAYAASRRAQ